jgi:hypothetical protein
MNIFMIDVESIGFHGEGFAVGIIVSNEKAKIIENVYFACHQDFARGTSDDRDWVKINVPKIKYDFDSPKSVRDAFWSMWEHYLGDSYMMGDCPYPVETNFLNACLDDDPSRKSVYPLLDLGSFLMCRGFNPVELHFRLDSELPVHHPLKDAMQATRLYWEYK